MAKSDAAAVVGQDNETTKEKEAGLIGSLFKGLGVFDMFQPDRPVITVGEIATHLGLHKSSASRIAATLVAAGYLRTAPKANGFHLGGKLTRLGSLAAIEPLLNSVAEPVMQRLVDQLGETCHTGVLDGREAVTVALLDGSFAIRMHSWIGKRSQAHVTAMGKVLLAGLSEVAIDKLYQSEECLLHPTPHSIATVTQLKKQLATVRQQGYALDDEELELGLRCVAAPIRDHDDRVVASLTIAGSTARIAPKNLQTYVKRVKEAAAQISAGLGASSVEGEDAPMRPARLSRA